MINERMGTAVHGRAREIIREYEGSPTKTLSVEIADSSGFGDWDRLTPAWILFVALKIEILALRDDGNSPEGIAQRLGGSMLGDTGLRLVRAIMGDMEEVRKPTDQSVVTLQGIVAMLSAAWVDGGITEADIEFRLAAAEDIALQSVRVIAGANGVGRGRDVGPWDIGELRDASAGRVDFGGLFVPVGRGVRLDPVYAGSGGPPVAITLFGDGTALQLQAYRAVVGRTWDVVRAQLRESVISSGGAADEWAGPAGFELRARQPVSKGRTKSSMDVRFIGCDGPGWLLRAIVTGRGAGSESVESWAYDTFSETVVNATFGDELGLDYIPLRWSGGR